MRVGGRGRVPLSPSCSSQNFFLEGTMAPGDVLALVFSVLNSLGLLPVIQVVAVVLAAVAVARYFLSRS